MNVLVLIPARGGSKGLPGKNLKPVAGISLVGHAVRVGRRFLREGDLRGSVVIDSDSAEIAAEAARWGAEAPFLRPAELASDGSPTIDSTLHTLDRLQAMGRHYDVLVLLQPTSPLRSVDDVAACFAAYDPSCEGVISIVAPDHPPVQAMTRAANGTIDWLWPDLRPDRQRQQLAPVFRPSGAVYVASVESLRARRAFIVPGVTRGVVIAGERSIDVDSAQDLALAQALVRARPVQPLTLDGRVIAPGQPCFVIARMTLPSAHAAEPLSLGLDAAMRCGADALSFVWEHAGRSGPAAGIGGLQTAALSGRVLQARAAGFSVLGPAPEGAMDTAQSLEGSLSGWVVGAERLGDAAALARWGGAGEPLLLRTTGASMAVLDQAFEALELHGDPEIGLLQGGADSGHGARGALVHMQDLQAVFAHPAGLADAKAGPFAIAAAALGAPLLELPFAPGAAAELEAFSATVRAIRTLEDDAAAPSSGRSGAL